MGHRLYIYDAHSGKLRVSEGSFMTIGAANTNTFQVNMKARIGGTFACKKDICRFFPHGSLESYSLDGAEMKRDINIEPLELHLVVLAGGCFLCWYGEEDVVEHFENLNSFCWFTYDLTAKAWSEPLRLSQICSMEDTLPPDTLITFEGLNNHAFFARDIMEASRFALERERVLAEQTDEADTGAYAIPKQITCRHCWERFMPDNILSIAAHPTLRGDSILGHSAMRRFVPQHYTPEGVPLDETGTPCRATACPYCHGKLPPFLTSSHQHLISTIGAPYSGKTYLLATMVNEAFKEFPRDFGLTFRDVDPKLNASFNQLRQQLFTAEDPFQAYLKNTEAGDPTMHSVWMQHGRHRVPLPLTYGVSRQGAASSYLVFYDTPGTSFLPGQDDAEATIAGGHMKAASAYFFVFDPTLSRSFRRLIPESDDPQMQLELTSTNLQTQMLSELDMQLRDELNQPPPNKLHVPLAIILDKSDAWLHLLGPEPLLPVVRHGNLQKACIRSNANRLRRLLFSIAPQVCAVAEALSDDVCYFAVSSLGKAPIAFEAPDNGGTYIGPASGAISPDHITDPLMWVLSTLEPDLIPHNN